MYAKISEDGAIWGTLFEKFFAKFFGNYEFVAAGIASQGIEAATGAPYQNIVHLQLSDPESLWRQLLSKAFNMVTCGSYNTGTDRETNGDGLPYMHAFSVLGVFELSIDGRTERIVQLRNPWGYEKYHGDWSDKDQRWTEEILVQVDHTLDNDGKFHMSWSDYIDQMQYTHISLNTFGRHQSYYLYENDSKPLNQEEPFLDGILYNKHFIKVRSKVDQNIYVSVYTHSDRHYQGLCKSLAKIPYSKTEVLLESHDDFDRLHVTNPGGYHKKVFPAKQNQWYDYSIYTNFSVNDHLPREWSFVVWSDVEPVTILVNDIM